jgi:hypothetical protein
VRSLSHLSFPKANMLSLQRPVRPLQGHPPDRRGQHNPPQEHQKHASS